MTDAELERIAALASAATKGPWEMLDDGEGGQTVYWERPWPPLAELHSTTPDDAAFIAAARDAVPALIAALQEARGDRTPREPSTVVAGGWTPADARTVLADFFSYLRNGPHDVGDVTLMAWDHGGYRGLSATSVTESGLIDDFLVWASQGE